LDKAYRGELVSQDPNDEPAKILLEKVKTQKAIMSKKRKSQTSL